MEHFLKEVEITNFKSIRHQKIEGCRRINVFIGYPNVGKSNVLEALSLFGYSPRETPQFSSLVRAQDTVELFFDGDISKDAEMVANGNDKIILKFFSDAEASLERIAQIKNPQEWHKIVDVQLRLIQQFEIAQNPTEGVLFDLAVNPHYSRVTVKKYHYESITPRAHKGNQSLYFPRGENLFFILETTPALRKEVSTIFRKYDLKIAFTKGEKYSLKALKSLQDDTIFLIPFYQIADTLQRLIFHKAAIASNQNTVLLFEEPEAHMFPPYIKLFTNDIVDKKSNQYFINTHSPFVLNELMEHGRDELSIYAVSLEDGATAIKRLTDEEVEEAYQYGVDLFFNVESYTA